MDHDILKKLDEQNQKLEKIALTLETIRRYYKWKMVLGIIVIIIPILGIIIAVPAFFKTFGLVGGLEF